MEHISFLRQLGFANKRWCLEGEVMVGDNCLKWLGQGEMVVVVEAVI